MADKSADKTEDKKKLRKVRNAVVVGSALEWFDFYIYGSMAALVFGPVFFPAASSATGTLASLATFAVGFLARPIGGMLFGSIGDRIGRKRALSYSFLLMGGASFLIGCVPSYDQIGIAAPCLLVLFRILQGLGAGGEVGGAMTMSYEHADPKRRGRQGAWTALGVNVGLLAASLTVTGLTSLDREFLLSWGWRIPFLASIALLALGFWIRRKTPETPQFESVATKTRSRGVLAPLVALFRSNWRGLLVVMVITLGYNGVSHTFKTFSLSYLTEFRDVPANVGAFGIVLASIAAIAIAPLAGRLCDRVDSAAVLFVGSVGIIAIAFPFFWLLDTGEPVLIWIGLTISAGILVPAAFAASGSYFARQFPAEVRTSGIGTGREISGAVSGGMTPLLAMSLVTMSDGASTWGVSLLFVVGGVCMAAGCLFDQGKRLEAGTGEVLAGSSNSR